MSSTGFDEFFRSDYLLLVGFLMKNGFGREEAKDAAAEAMLEAYKSWSQIESPRSWARRVAYRIACNQRKRGRIEVIKATEADWVNSIHTDPDVVQINEECELLRLLERLPRKQCLVMAWHLDGFSDEEIAKHLGMNLTTVRSHRRHARNRLKEVYQPDMLVTRGREQSDE